MRTAAEMLGLARSRAPRRGLGAGAEFVGWGPRLDGRIGRFTAFEGLAKYILQHAGIGARGEHADGWLVTTGRGRLGGFGLRLLSRLALPCRRGAVRAFFRRGRSRQCVAGGIRCRAGCFRRHGRGLVGRPFGLARRSRRGGRKPEEVHGSRGGAGRRGRGLHQPIILAIGGGHPRGKITVRRAIAQARHFEIGNDACCLWSPGVFQGFRDEAETNALDDEVEQPLGVLTLAGGQRANGLGEAKGIGDARFVVAARHVERPAERIHQHEQAVGHAVPAAEQHAPEAAGDLRRAAAGGRAAVRRNIGCDRAELDGETLRHDGRGGGRIGHRANRRQHDVLPLSGIVNFGSQVIVMTAHAVASHSSLFRPPCIRSTARGLPGEHHRGGGTPSSHLRIELASRLIVLMSL